MASRRLVAMVNHRTEQPLSARRGRAHERSQLERVRNVALNNNNILILLFGTTNGMKLMGLYVNHLV